MVCKIGGKLVLITNRKSHRSFRLVPTSITLDDLERRNSPYLAFFRRLRFLCCPKTSQWLNIDLMKLFSSTSIDTINDCRRYFDFQIPGEVLEKKRARFQRKFAVCKDLHRYFGILGVI